MAPLTLLWIALAGTGARTAALALNRLLDRAIDAQNPRTRVRELPSGRMSVGEGVLLAVAGTAVYVAAAAMLNPLCLRALADPARGVRALSAAQALHAAVPLRRRRGARAVAARRVSSP